MSLQMTSNPPQEFALPGGCKHLILFPVLMAIPLILLVALGGSGCMAPRVDPLAGWAYCDHSDPIYKDKVVSDD